MSSSCWGKSGLCMYPIHDVMAITVQSEHTVTWTDKQHSMSTKNNSLSALWSVILWTVIHHGYVAIVIFKFSLGPSTTGPAASSVMPRSWSMLTKYGRPEGSPAFPGAMFWTSNSIVVFWNNYYSNSDKTVIWICIRINLLRYGINKYIWYVDSSARGVMVMLLCLQPWFHAILQCQ